ncbi:MAG: hypothetical protein ACT4OM_13850 [Actinomycetota bacterium]
MDFIRNFAAGPELKIRPVTPFETLFDHNWFLKCKVKILVVTDSGSGGYGEISGFHLGQVLKIVAQDSWPHIVFDFTKAHRQVSGEAGVIDNFRFNNHKLNQYDQVWLFGILTDSDALSDAELKSLSMFMDQGGGVFATGDHQNLGQPMCGEVPRVRSMRRWYWPAAGPNGEPVAPDQIGAGRHDTVVDTDPNQAGLQGTQSDEVPQVIRPRWYTAWSLSPVITKQVRFPHPVLCGPKGAITHLPDHMHEGLCEVPADLTGSFNFDGYATTEYPELNGHQEVPQVIGWATNHVQNAQFGVLAAYDGHRSGVGRVVVDATWHHWFNINLVGFIAATDPANPAFDPSVVPEWEEIKAYFRNVGAWLAPPAKQKCLRNGGWLLALKNLEVLMTLRKKESGVATLAYFWQLGVFARDALGRLASQCQYRVWLCELFKSFNVRLVPDPWEIRPIPMPDPPPFLESADLEAVAFGAAIHALGERFAEETDLQRLVDETGEEVEAVAARGAAEGLGMLFKGLQDGARSAKRLADEMDRKL